MKGTGGRKRPIYISDDGLLRDPGGYYWRKVRGLRWSCERPEDAVRNCKTKTREKNNVDCHCGQIQIDQSLAKLSDNVWRSRFLVGYSEHDCGRGHVDFRGGQFSTARDQCQLNGPILGLR